MVKIISQNVRGLKDDLKRKMVFNYLRDKADIVCIQETHGDEKTNNLWENMWGGKAFWSNGENNSRGVGILLTKNCDIEVLNSFKDKEGRYVGIEYKQCNEKFILCCVYAPNNDDVEFFLEMFRMIENYEGKRMLVGDFNLVLEKKLDSSSETRKNNDRSSEILRKYMEESLLTDIWRARNEDTKTYTFFYKRRGKDRLGSRLDYMLFDASLNSWVKKVQIVPGFKSDHSGIICEINPFEIYRGRGLWRLNTCVLSERGYIDKINETIQKVKIESSNLNIQEKWELIKLMVICESQDYCRERAQDRKLIINQLELAIQKMEEKCCEKDFSEAENNLLERSKADYSKMMEEKINGAILRCKAQNYAEFEHPNSKYFFQLEKNRAGAKAMSSMIKEDGSEIIDTKQILREQERFYSKLYTSDPTVEFDYVNDSEIKITENEKEEIDKEITMAELEQAVKQLRRQCTPGTTGLPVEFYIVFWSQIREIVFEVIQVGLQEGRLHESALRAVISLIPKPGKDTRKIECLRPISLQNTDYKVIEKILANRLKPVLEGLINEDQKGFMASRRISCNIRRILDMVEDSEDNGGGGLVVSLDFMKCFDRIEINSLLAALAYFNIGPRFIGWTKTIYTDAKACVINNGYFSNYFDVTRGTKQGGCCSPYYFLVIAEVLAIELRKNSRIKGFSMKEIQKLLGQYADDIDIYLKGDQESLDQVFYTIEEFQKRSGFSINYSKSTVYRLGSLRKSKAMLYTRMSLSWMDTINVLGVYVTHDKDLLYKLNYDNLVIKVESIFKSWGKRGLSLYGKALIVNSLVGSLFVYRMTVLPTIPDHYISKLNELVKKFVWSGGRSKISLEVLQSEQQHGGLGIVNFKLKDQSLKVGWVQMLKTDSFLAEFAYSKLNYVLKDIIWQCNLKTADIKKLFENSFWRDVLLAWSKYNYDDDVSDPENQVIWLNSHIRVRGKPFMNSKAYKNGLIFVSQLCDVNGGLIGQHFCKEMFELSYLEYGSIVSALPAEWVAMIRNPKPFKGNQKYENFMVKKKCVSFYYHEINARCQFLNRIVLKWERKGFVLELTQMEEAFINIRLVTENRKLRSFQYRLLHRTIILNKQLCLWKMKNTSLCNNCNKEIESLEHFFWECETAKRVWKWVREICMKLFKDEITIDYERVMLNGINSKPNHVYNFVCLTAKHWMYVNRCLDKKLGKLSLETKITEFKRSEFYYAKRNNNTSKFYRKWMNILTPSQLSENNIENAEDIAIRYILDKE